MGWGGVGVEWGGGDLDEVKRMRQTDRQADRQTDSETYRRTDRQ